LDFVPQPYFLVKARTMSPNELALAENGNFLVRDRVRKVLELLAPGQCGFYPTCFAKTTEVTPWFLAVPKHQLPPGVKVDPKIPRCEACGEPRSAHGTQLVKPDFTPTAADLLRTNESEFEILKSSSWLSSEKSWSDWIMRGLFFSIRLIELLKKIEAKGLVSGYHCYAALSPEKSEKAWARQQAAFLEEQGIPMRAPGTVSAQDTKWFNGYLKTHGRTEPLSFDVKTLEKRIKHKLPKSYLDFVSRVGPVTFENVDQEQGFSATVLTPDDLEIAEYRKGVLATGDEQTDSVDGIMFARTEHGDCFCFDLKKGTKENAVVIFKHEYNAFEPYAENFAACIKRFAGE
jgi:hypothetical protein